MRKGGSKQKGSAFERLVCKQLSLLISKGRRTDLFWRSAMSGGRATLELKKDVLNQTQAGDISSIDMDSGWLTRDYMIECKHYNDLQFTSGFLSGTGNLYKFWTKLFKDAIARNKKPILIAKQNNRPIVMLTSPGSCPQLSVDPVVTLHDWPAEIRLFSEIDQLIEEIEEGA
jgi:hypothetical protein